MLTRNVFLLAYGFPNLLEYLLSELFFIYPFLGAGVCQLTNTSELSARVCQLSLNSLWDTEERGTLLWSVSDLQWSPPGFPAQCICTMITDPKLIILYWDPNYDFAFASDFYCKPRFLIEALELVFQLVFYCLMILRQSILLFCSGK